MSITINSVIIGGNLTRDPEVKALSANSSVTKFGLAVNRRYKQGDEWKNEVSFLDCSAWGTTGANVAKYLTKGSSCVVQGHLKVESWDASDGSGKRTKVVIIAEQVSFLDKPTQADTEAIPAQPPKVSRSFAPGVRAVADDSEPPFVQYFDSLGWA